LAIMGMMRKDHARQTYVIPPLKCREFDWQINILYSRMVAKVINMCPFFRFLQNPILRNNSYHTCFNVCSVF
jgi:hypothetical protein